MPFLNTASPKKQPFDSGGVARFDVENFDTHISELGYEVLVFRAVAAPKFREHDSLLTDNNSRGGHYIWINPIKTTAIIQSATQEFMYAEDGLLVNNQILATFQAQDKVARMDKIVLSESSFEFTESIEPFRTSTNWKAYTTYPIKGIYVIFKYDGDEVKYKKLEEGVDFTVEENIIILDEVLYPLTLEPKDVAMSIRYTAVPVYFVQTFLHEIRSTKNDALQFEKLPVQVVAKLAHTILDIENEAGDYYLNNSFDEVSCTNEAKFIKGDLNQSSYPTDSNLGDLELI